VDENGEKERASEGFQGGSLNNRHSASIAVVNTPRMCRELSST
jgi:hypothetical protein